MASDERRHQVEEKTYAVFNANSINVMAESIGLPPINSDAAAALGEDVSYRTRQVLNLATQHMKHSKRRRLCGDDFNRAAKDLNVTPVHGHSSQDPAPFRYIKEAQVHCVEDPEVNLVDIALGDYAPRHIGKPSIKAHWLAVEGVLRTGPNNSTGSQGKAGKEMSPTHLKYYNCITKALLSANAEVKKRALQDLKTNSALMPVLPYLINFVLNGIKNMSHDIEHLTAMLNAVRALLHNKSLYLMHKPYLATIVFGVEFCVLEPLAASINSANDHWVLRDYAARLLAEIVNRWNSPQNHLRFNITKCLKDVLHDTNKPFYSHYGAIMALIALGHKAVEDVIIPYLPSYWPHLKAAMEDSSTENQVVRLDSHRAHGALRLAAEKVMRKMMKKFENEMQAEKELNETKELLGIDENAIEVKGHIDTPVGGRSQGQKALDMYKELEEYFGDSLSACLPLLHTKDFFKPVKKEEVVSLGDHNSGKSGDELLDNLMQQIYLQEKLDQERKAQELKKQKERELLEKERRAKEALERKKREEQEERMRKLREEEEQRMKRLEMEEAERQKKLREEERRQHEIDEKLHELNRNRRRPQWQQEIELRRQQLEEEMQYSRMMEARKRREEEAKHKRSERARDDSDRARSATEDELANRRGLRRRKPVNYTEKDEDISDLIDDRTSKIARPPLRLPFHSDISDDSEDIDENRRILASQSPASSGDGLAVSSTMAHPHKGTLKLKIKRQSMHSSSPPYPVSGMSQHGSPSYQSPSMLSPRHPSPLSVPISLSPAALTHYPKSKSSSGSDKESKQNKSTSGNIGGKVRSTSVGNAGLLDSWDFEDAFADRPQGSIPPQLNSPEAESSGSDSNPHRKALKLKLKLTPNHTPE